MLKPAIIYLINLFAFPAAFRRLCVETTDICGGQKWLAPAAFRRLCVETMNPDFVEGDVIPAAFRRLCVETHKTGKGNTSRISRL